MAQTSAKYYVKNPATGRQAVSSEQIAGMATVYYSSKRIKEIKGSPFWHEDFLPSELHLYTGDVITNIPMRYNIYSNQMTFIHKEDTMQIADPTKVEKIIINGEMFVYSLAFTEKMYEGHSYLKVLADGDMKLLLRKVKDIKEDKYVSNYMGGGGSGDKMFSTTSAYYYKYRDHNAIRLGYSRWGVINAFPKENRDEIKEFIKKNDLKVRKEEDLVKVFNYFNETIRQA